MPNLTTADIEIEFQVESFKFRVTAKGDGPPNRS